MPLLSVKISDKLERKLTLKAKEFDIKTQSELVRCLLNFAIENYDGSEVIVKNPLHKKIATYNLLTYFLLERFVSEDVEDGQNLIEEASKKAEKIAADLLK